MKTLGIWLLLLIIALAMLAPFCDALPQGEHTHPTNDDYVWLFLPPAALFTASIFLLFVIWRAHDKQQTSYLEILALVTLALIFNLFFGLLAALGALHPPNCAYYQDGYYCGADFVFSMDEINEQVATSWMTTTFNFAALSLVQLLNYWILKTWRKRRAKQQDPLPSSAGRWRVSSTISTIIAGLLFFYGYLGWEADCINNPQLPCTLIGMLMGMLYSFLGSFFCPIVIKG